MLIKVANFYSKEQTLLIDQDRKALKTIFLIILKIRQYHPFDIIVNDTKRDPCVSVQIPQLITYLAI